MPNHPHYKFSDTESTTLYEVGANVVCTTARFVFDEPIIVRAGEAIELRDGQWFLEGEQTPIQGRWDR